MRQDAPRNDVDPDDRLLDFDSEAPNSALDKKESDVAFTETNRMRPSTEASRSHFDSREAGQRFRQKRSGDRFQQTRAGHHVRHKEAGHSAGRARASPARTVRPAFCEVHVGSRCSQERKAPHRHRAAHAREHRRLGMVGPFVDGNAP